MRHVIVLSGLLASASCGGGDEPGTLEIAIYGESFVEDGIPASAFTDGWEVEFQTFEVTLTDVTAAAGDDEPALVSADAGRFELTEPSGGAGQLVVAGDVPGGLYDRIGYRIASLRVEGTARRGEVTKSFAWDGFTPTHYQRCEGTAVVDGDPARTELTIHADHLFYDDLVAPEPDLAFDLLAAADDRGDGDGAVTEEELAAVDITGEERYQVGNATDVTDLWSYLDRQGSSVGHIDGEGHCAEAIRE